MLGPIRYFLRARRAALTYMWTALYNLIFGSNAPTKHIKIDDEERQLNNQDPFPPRPRSPLSIILKMLLLILLTLLIILLFLAYIIYKPPAPVISYFQHKYPSIIFQVPTSQRVLALTIDDAPSPHTAQILDLLKTYNAKATFFIIGSQVSSPSDHAILERIHAEGHETGNHAMFDEPSASLPLAELKHQIQDVEKLLPENGSGKKWFRPGSGFFSKAMVELVEGMGYRMVLGSVYPHDAKIRSARVNAGHVLSMVREGAVVIVHDRRPYSVDEIGRILKGLEGGGWRVESLGGLLKVAEEEKVKKGG